MGLTAAALLGVGGDGVAVCVDRMAASGGYMLACVANRLLAAPFASIGSIGVKISTINVDKLAQRWGITVENFSAGKHIVVLVRMLVRQL